MSPDTYRGWRIEPPAGLRKHWAATSPDFAMSLDDEHEGEIAFGDSRAEIEAEIDEIEESKA
jgi:hypothetical protein